MRRVAFSLIELLVAVSLIGILIALLLPALAMSRRQARLSTCGINQRQNHIGLVAHAADHKNHVPRGPDVPIAFLPAHNWSDMGTLLIWIPYFGGMLNIPSPGATNALGVLMNGNYLSHPRSLFCPGDNVNDDPANLQTFLARDPNVQAYGSYLYRQLDQTTGRDNFDDLGVNEAGLRVRALAFDQVIEGFNGEWKDNHGRRAVNVLYDDGHVKIVDHCRDAMVFRAIDGNDPSPVAAFTNLEARVDQILVNADFSATGDASEAPQLP